MQRPCGRNKLPLTEEPNKGLLAGALWPQEMRWGGALIGCGGTLEAIEPFKKGNEMIGCLF